MKKWSFRACALTAALLVLAPMFVPLSAHADTTSSGVLCNTTSQPVVTGSGLANFERVDYSSDGWAQLHFALEPTATTHSLWMVYQRTDADSCYAKASSFLQNVILPATVNKFSIHTTNYSTYEIYDDETNLPVKCSLCSNTTGVPFNGAPNDRIIVQMGLADNSGDLLSTFHPYWDPSRPLPPHPLIIIPGATGTALNKNSDTVWPDLVNMALSPTDNFMDSLGFNPDLTPVDPQVQPGKVIDKIELLDTPVYDYTDRFIRYLSTQGYEKDQNLFVFPYDWRKPIDTSVTELRKFVRRVQAQTGLWYVDAVAHSMGGLVLKQYINKTSLGGVHLDKAIFAGTPFLGAPKTLKTLLFGDNLDIPVLSSAEIKQVGTNMPGLYQLLPSRQYYDQIGSALSLTQPQSYDQMIIFGNDQGMNPAAWQLADQFHSAEFDGLDLRPKSTDVYILAGCGSPTLQSIKLHQSVDGTVLEGYQPTFTGGDGTVPTPSAIATPVDSSKIIYSTAVDHGHLLSAPGMAEQILRLLQDDTTPPEGHLTTDAQRCGLSGRLISIFSPLDITAQDSSGHVVGRLSDGQIRKDLATAGYEELGDHKFLFWPDSEPAPHLALQGTATGTFTLSIETIKNNETLSTANYTNIPVSPSLSGQIDLSNGSSLQLDIDGDGQNDQSLPPTSITLPDKTAPELTLNLNPNSHSLILTGRDETSFTKVTDEISRILVTDAAGNKTTLELNRQDGKRTFKVELLRLTYNGSDTHTASAKLDYSWSADNLVQELTLGDTLVKAVYDGQNTKITTKTGNGKGQVQTLRGLVLLKVSTNKGGLTWST